VTFRFRYFLAAVLGLGLAHSLPAQEPARLPIETGRDANTGVSAATNQTIAIRIAERLSHSGQLRRYSLDVVYQDGTARLSGIVADADQRDEAIRLAHAVPGVERVVDQMSVAGSSPIARTQATAPALPEAAPPPRTDAPPPPVGVRPIDPVPLYQGCPTMPYDLNPPKLPPYAWPTYAPYNNYSRVAYPNLYPYQSWPFIGPCYPFPKVPLGWRSVKLTWQDGHWWYGKNATGHDWWRLRYW
jgi:hypothetical protein